MLAEVLLNDLSSLEQVSEPATKLFLCWYRKVEDDDINVTFAEALEGISWGRKSQTLVEQVLKEIVEDRKLAVQRRCQALVTRGNLQQKAPASRIWLESLLRDETAVGTFAFEDKNKSTCETQLRDVALLLLVEYFGPPNAKKYKEFRFAFAQSGSSREDFYEPAAFGFQKPEDRAAALAKWKDQPPAAAKPTGKKKGKK
jgi:hypothetical protein